MAESTDYLSADEVQAIQHLPRTAPYSITRISHSIFSVARHYGGMSYSGAHYTYVPEHDECVRTDVLRFVEKRRRQQAKETKRAAKAAQGALALDDSGSQQA
jgi:hypothetical protein